MTPVVVVGIDETAAARAAVEVAAAEACRRAAQLRIVCCWDLPSVVYTSGIGLAEMLEKLVKQDAEERLEAVASSLERAHPELEVETRSFWGPPTSGLVEASRDADLLVLGSRRRRRLARSIFGSTSREISRVAACPVRMVAL